MTNQLINRTVLIFHAGGSTKRALGTELNLINLFETNNFQNQNFATTIFNFCKYLNINETIFIWIKKIMTSIANLWDFIYLVFEKKWIYESLLFILLRYFKYPSNNT